MADTRTRLLTRLQAELDRRAAAHLRRHLAPVGGPAGAVIRIANKEYLQFCTNNYLGIANDPAVVAAAQEAAARYGVGAGASRLVAGSLELHHELETQLAAFKGAEAGLIFPTGFMANLAVLTTLARPADLIVSDKLNHASLLDAAKFSGATHRTFPHRRYARAEALLGRGESRRAENAEEAQAFLVTDTVFSMDGDLADLPALCATAGRTGALVILDEAHATGVLGPTGAGLAEAQGVCDRITVSVATLSKAFGVVGGFVTGPQAVIDTLINAARPFIYTTALPALCSAAALAALRIIQREPQHRTRVLALAAYVRTELRALGYDVGDSQTPIIPVLLGSAERALHAAEYLKEHGIWVPAIRPPTVPPGTARLRLSLMATHTDAQIEHLLQTLRTLRAHLP